LCPHNSRRDRRFPGQGEEKGKKKRPVRREGEGSKGAVAVVFLVEMAKRGGEGKGKKKCGAKRVVDGV